MFFSFCRISTGLVLLSSLTACATIVPSDVQTNTSGAAVTPATSAAMANPPSRFGTITLAAVEGSGISGTFTARDNGDGTTLLGISLVNAAEFHPWGIHASASCDAGVPLDQRPIFELPDIENGHKQETVETPAYKIFPGNLIVVVFGIAPDGSQRIVACADLGPAAAGDVSASSAASPSASPDCATGAILGKGGWLAFSATQNSNGDIYLLNVQDALKAGNDSARLRLTTNPAADFDPTWSPDGTRIAFRSQRDGNDEIYVMNVDGTCQANLTNDSVNEWSPAWSPDGTRIAFARFYDSNSFTDIAVINLDGSGLTRLTTDSGEYPTWSPDGKRIAFSTARDGNYEIYVMNADGTGQTRLTNNPAYDMSPAWSPDEKRIAFDTQRDFPHPAEVGIGPEFEIHVMNVDGSGDTRLTDNALEDRFPEWVSSDTLVFSQNGQLVMLRLDSSGKIQLIGSGTFPAWHSFDR